MHAGIDEVRESSATDWLPFHLIALQWFIMASSETRLANLCITDEIKLII